jgi:hypothetical protein
MAMQRQQPTRRRFTVEEYLALEAALELPALGCRLALADLYEVVELPDESA